MWASALHRFRRRQNESYATAGPADECNLLRRNGQTVGRDSCLEGRGKREELKEHVEPVFYGYCGG